MDEELNIQLNYDELSNKIKFIVEMSGNVTEEGILEVARNNAKTFGYEERDVKHIADLVLEKTSHTIGSEGLSLTDGRHEQWYLPRKAEIDRSLEERNLIYLSKDKGLSEKVKFTLDRTTDRIIDLFGDPKTKSFSRKGLVMGDVQSGKTNTYTLLCCKAASAGYKIIILLTGNNESLRKQTQGRIDEGFIGRDSDILLKGAGSARKIGAGKIPMSSTLTVQCLTSKSSDFSKEAAKSKNVVITDPNISPYVFVIKKNKDNLESLASWLEALNVDIEGEKIDQPLLMIDDEADNASINTKKGNDVTKINGLIRKILGLFTRSTYCGFTATPFANVFINPDEEDNLFPRHFVYLLDTADNYVGPDRIYSEEKEGSLYNLLLREKIQYDRRMKPAGLPELPLKHRKSDRMEGIPESLKQAMNEFLLSCAVRDLRGQKKSHMSMLINMSWYTDVQDDIREKVDFELSKIQGSVKAYSKMSENDALKDPCIKSLRTTWEREYSKCPDGFDEKYPSWKQVQHTLESSIIPISVITVNTKSKGIDYSDAPDGLRVIVIGGNSLSRGMTLEGLCISYFYRNSKLYDTLTQMGRWFGYRDGYLDLCRVWMTEDCIGWYSGINDAIQDLKRRFRRMAKSGKPPSEFGLLVENDLTYLEITSRNKLLHAAAPMYKSVSVSGKAIDTYHFYKDPENITHNYMVVEKVLGDIENFGITAWRNNVTGNVVWRKVPKKFVIFLLQHYRNPSANIIFDSEITLNLLRDDGISCLEFWDIAVVSRKKPEGKNRKVVLLGNEINRPSRTAWAPFEDDPRVLKMNNRRIITPTDTREGLFCIDPTTGEEEYDKELERSLKKEDDDNEGVSATTFLQTDNRRPLLLIYLLDLEKEGSSLSDDMKDIADEVNGLFPATPVSLAIGYPAIGELGKTTDKLVMKYLPNVIYSRFGDDGDVDEEEDT